MRTRAVLASIPKATTIRGRRSSPLPSRLDRCLPCCTFVVQAADNHVHKTYAIKLERGLDGTDIPPSHPPTHPTHPLLLFALLTPLCVCMCV